MVSSFTFTQKLITHEPIEFVEHARAFSSVIAVWRWNFGDGTQTESQTTSHTYNKSGDYTVSLQVEDKFNTSDRYEVVLHITNPKPIAGFDSEPPAPKTSDTVKFKSESQDNGTITRWRWNFGDGATSTEENPSHNYAKASQYKVTLIVTDDEGAESEPFTRTIEAGGTAPEASFTFAPTDPFEKEQVTFDANASKDIDGEIKEWNWDFGDETACPPDCGSGTPQKPVHAYAKPGRYTVYLIVKDNTDMQSKPAKQVVDVGMRALAGFIADPKALGTPQVPSWLDYYLRDGKASQDEVTDILWRVIVGAYVPGTYYRPMWTDFQAVHEIHQLREFTEKYRDIEVAHADGYVEAGPYVEGVGQALVERSRFGKEVNHIKPPILLYLKDKDGKLQFAGVRFVVSNPEAANRFGVTNWPKITAAAHYADGSTVPAKTREEAPATNGSAAFVFWQPDLYVLTLWVMQPNPAGFFNPVFVQNALVGSNMTPKNQPESAEKEKKCSLTVDLVSKELVSNDHVGDDWTFSVSVNDSSLADPRLGRIYQQNFENTLLLKIVAKAIEKDNGTMHLTKQATWYIMRLSRKGLQNESHPSCENERRPSTRILRVYTLAEWPRLSSLWLSGCHST
ncbi:PKD domain-containing protein [Candidatus Acetothermia bacterium]|nr:PKD domain-containing protein [Candidatus Acetothermia bacterium]